MNEELILSLTNKLKSIMYDLDHLDMESNGLAEKVASIAQEKESLEKIVYGEIDKNIGKLAAARQTVDDAPIESQGAMKLIFKSRYGMSYDTINSVINASLLRSGGPSALH